MGVALALLGASACSEAARPPDAPDVQDTFDRVKLSPRRLEIERAWRALPVPPITPYSGPFGPEARAFIGKLTGPLQAAFCDWERKGTYDPDKDPRPINHKYEAAVLEDWRRMGYNTAYKGNYWTYRSGRWLKKQGLLGAIDQTLWAAKGDPPLGYDGTPGRRYNESCGSFFVKKNFDAGVTAVANMAIHHGEKDLLKVGDYYITSSWDEIGIRTRTMIDYRPEAIDEYRGYLQHVWFQDNSPGEDTNKDGRTYNQFTGERLREWSQVRPPKLSRKYFNGLKPGDEKWTRPGAYKLWVDFHRYYTFEFFRRINDAATKKAGKKIECYPFPQAFIVWPGADYAHGMSVYWNARLNPIVTIMQCWPDNPAMLLHYAQMDRLARKFHNIVIGWGWFYFADEAGDQYDGPGDLERALARMLGHRVDGLHHWLYSPQYRGRHRGQRRQMAYWHNFLGKQYATFLARSAPPPAQVALLIPDYTGYFYRVFHYPKTDYAYTAAALSEAQIPFEIVSEEEIDLDPQTLAPYRALYVVGSEWTTPTIRKRIQEFIARGGTVFANVDSLSLDIPTGKRIDFLENTFGIALSHKYKNPFYPSAQNAEEEVWAAPLVVWRGPLSFQGHYLHNRGALSPLWKQQGGKVVRNEEQWRKVDAIMAKMPKTGRGGLPQSAIDMRNPPVVKYAKSVGPKRGLVAYGEINVGRVRKGKAIAWYKGQVCGVETERTVWLGTRPGVSLHAIAPRLSLSRPTEPCNPYPVEVSPKYATHKPYVDLLAYAARKAGVRPLVRITLGRETPYNLEVLPRVDAEGNMMVIVVNHDDTDAVYDVQIDPRYVAQKLPKKSTAWNALEGKLIERKTDGRFKLAVPPFRPAVFFVGSQEVLEPIQKAQASLAAMDLSVPQYFLDRPELNEPLWDTPIPKD